MKPKIEGGISLLHAKGRSESLRTDSLIVLHRAPKMHNYKFQFLSPATWIYVAWKQIAEVI